MGTDALEVTKIAEQWRAAGKDVEPDTPAGFAAGNSLFVLIAGFVFSALIGAFSRRRHKRA